MWKTRLIYFAALLIFFLLWLRNGAYGTLSLLIAFIAVPLVSLAMTAAVRSRITFGMTAAKAWYSDDEHVINLIVRNSSLLPAANVSLTFETDNALTLASVKSKVDFSVSGKADESIPIYLGEICSGTITVRNVKTEFYDCFGLFRLRGKTGEEKAIASFPQIGELPLEFEEIFGRAYESERYSENKPGSDVSEVFDTHMYVPGDEIRKINWKLSCKYDELIVRDFSYPLNSLITIMLELSKDEEEVTDRCIKLFLSFSRSLIDSGVVHNICWYDGNAELFVKKEISSLEEFENAEAALIDAGGYEDMGLALLYYTENIYERNGTLFYISSQPNRELIEELTVEQDVIELTPDDAYDMRSRIFSL